MQFEFSTAGRILFGAGTAAQVGPIAAAAGVKRACVVVGRTTERAQGVLESLDRCGIACVTFHVCSEPSTAVVKVGAERARSAGCEGVISVGGGSIMDTGKVIAAMLTNEGQLEDYLEVVGAGREIQKRAAMHIAVATTAGTGAEVTRNAVIAVPEQRVKVSMRSRLLLPQVAVVDPELTYSMPPAVTASTGLDALTQLVEAFVSNRANPLTDGLCREALVRVGRYLRRAFEDGQDRQAREAMAMASLFSGMALANAKLGAVHGFAGVIGGMFSAPHGAVCGRLLPLVMEANVKALERQKDGGVILERFDEAARLLTGRTEAGRQEAVEWVQRLCEDLQVPPLGSYGVTKDQIGQIVDKAQRASSMKGNPVVLSDEELAGIIARAL